MGGFWSEASRGLDKGYGLGFRAAQRAEDRKLSQQQLELSKNRDTRQKEAHDLKMMGARAAQKAMEAKKIVVMGNHSPEAYAEAYGLVNDGRDVTPKLDPASGGVSFVDQDGNTAARFGNIDDMRKVLGGYLNDKNFWIEQAFLDMETAAEKARADHRADNESRLIRERGAENRKTALFRRQHGLGGAGKTSGPDFFVKEDYKRIGRQVQAIDGMLASGTDDLNREITDETRRQLEKSRADLIARMDQISGRAKPDIAPEFPTGKEADSIATGLWNKVDAKNRTQDIDAVVALSRKRYGDEVADKIQQLYQKKRKRTLLLEASGLGRQAQLAPSHHRTSAQGTAVEASGGLGLARNRQPTSSGNRFIDRLKGAKITNPVIDENGVVWANVDGRTRRLAVKPAEKIYNNRIDNPEYKEYLDLLEKLGIGK